MNSLAPRLLTALVVSSFASLACGGEDPDPPRNDGSGAGSTSASGGASSSGGSQSAPGGSSVTSGGASGASASGGTGTSTGGTAGGDATGCTLIDECTAADALSADPIADFESAVGWYLFAPDDAGASTMPSDGQVIPAEEISCPAGGRCGSSFAMHVSGSGYTSYGPSLSNDYVTVDMEGMPMGTPHDASAATGIMFWARKGDTAGAAPSLRLTVLDKNSHPGGGVCDPEATPGMMSEACFDGFSKVVAVVSGWKLYKIPFSELAQQGFGKAAEAFSPAEVYGLTFSLPNMATFDFWIDDVAFYTE